MKLKLESPGGQGCKTKPSLGGVWIFSETAHCIVVYCIVLCCVVLYCIVNSEGYLTRYILKMKHIFFFFWQSKDPYKNGKLIFFPSL